MSNLSLLSAVAGVGMADPFSDLGIPSRRIYTLTERTAAAWSKFLDRAAVGGDPYTLTERSGALEAARAFLDSIPLDRLSRVRKATVTKLIRHLESPMARSSNPRSYPNIDKSGFHKGRYIGYAGPVTYNISEGPSGDWVADLDSRYRESPWVMAGLAPYHFKTMRLGDASERLSRIAKACETLSPDSRAHAISRTDNPEDSASTPLNDKILLPFKLGYGSLTVAELLQKAAAKRGEPISEKEAAKRAKGFRQGLLIEGSPVLLQRLKKQRASGRPMGWVSGPLVIFNASHYIRIHGRGGSKITPEGDVVFGDDLLRTLPEFRLQDIRFADPDGTLHDDEARFLRSGSPSHAGTRTDNPTSSTLQVIRQYLPNAARRGAAYAGSVGEGAAKRSIWIEPADRSATVKVYRYADPRIDNTLSAHVLESEYSGDLATVVLRAVQVAEATIAEHAGTRTGNPRRPKLVWEFDGEPTSPAELLSSNPGNGDVAAAIKYLKAEAAKFGASARSWSAVSFGGGAADESYLTVRADWTAGPVFAAVLNASTIPYAGDLPDAD